MTVEITKTVTREITVSKLFELLEIPLGHDLHLTYYSYGTYMCNLYIPSETDSKEVRVEVKYSKKTIDQ